MLNLFAADGKTADLTEASTLLLPRLLGWEGRILGSSPLPSRPGGSQRLVDLAGLTGARAYLWGTGGMRYLQAEPFIDRGVEVIPFRTPSTGMWKDARRVSALREVMLHGPDALVHELLPASPLSVLHR
ncbi:WbqC family protein [Streptomyces sp. BYX5S]